MVGQSVVISTTTSGAVALVAAVPGTKIVVTGYVIVSAGTVNVTFKSATTALTGAMPLVANSVVSAPLSRSQGVHCGWFETAANEALNIVCDATVGVYGHIKYELEAA